MEEELEHVGIDAIGDHAQEFAAVRGHGADDMLAREKSCASILPAQELPTFNCRIGCYSGREPVAQPATCNLPNRN